MILSWGKPRVVVQKLGEPLGSWIEFPTGVENSTQLATAKGTKQEAKIEGGENEGVRYGKNNYSLATTIRAAKGRKKPIKDTNGVITGEYKVMIQPEDPSVEGICIDKATFSVEDGWTAADGGTWIYTADALKPASGDLVKWGTVAITEAGGAISAVTFTESVAE